MELNIIQSPEKGILGGPKNKCFSVCRNGIHYRITINQCGVRQINIASSKGGTIKDIFNIYYTTVTLLMLLDGQFYPVVRAFENDVEITNAWEKHALPSYHSANFMTGAGNKLLDFNAILDARLFQAWSRLREELGLVHQMALYCLSGINMPKDMQCALMVEAFEVLSELIDIREPEFVLPKAKDGESKLRKYFLTIIPYFGALIFEKEMQYNLETFAQILVNTRNRIAHIKSKEGKVYFKSEENVMYLMKLSLLYRVVLFHLLEIPEILFKDKLSLQAQVINNYKITQMFLERLEQMKGGLA